MNVNVVFQPRTASGGDYCGQDSILLSPGDLRALRCKAGVQISVYSPDSQVTLICRAWPSKKAVGNGTATLNRVWWPTFPGDKKTRSCFLSKDTSAFLIAPCRKATLSIQFATRSDGDESEIFKSGLFAQFAAGGFEGVPMTEGLTMGLSWKGAPILLNVLSCQTEEVVCGSSGRSVRYLLDSTTQIVIVPASNHEEHLSVVPPIIQISASTSISGFAGYESQSDEAWNCLCLGLGLGEPGRRLVALADATLSGGSDFSGSFPAPSTLLFKPPRGLLLYGPPGTGKTTLLNSLAKRAGCAVLELSHSVLLHQYAGEAERQVQAVFDLAERRAPCCVLVDDADLLFRSRADTTATDLQRRVVSCILARLDGVADGESHSNSQDRNRVRVRGQGVFVLAATSRPTAVDPAFRRPGRLDREIELPVPNVYQREKILTLLVSRAQSATVDDVPLSSGRGSSPGGEGCWLSLNGLSAAGVKAASQRAHGMVGADLLQVLREAQLLALGRLVPSSAVSPDTLRTLLDSLSLEDSQPPPPPTLQQAAGMPQASLPSSMTSGHVRGCTDADLLLALTKVPPSALREVVVEVPTVRWSDIGGMDAVKQCLREVVEWPLLHADLLVSFCVQPPRGVLLYGPPGCSKTLMAKALATEAGMNFLAVRGPELLSKWLGESEKAVQALFRRARAAAPSIVFFDEIDALAGRRGSSSAGVNDRVLAQLLAELDGIGSFKDKGLHSGAQRVIVVAATNRPDMLDPALLRPGRVDRKVFVSPPDAASRRQILQIELARLETGRESTANQEQEQEQEQQLQEAQLLDHLVQLTEGFSGAEVVAVVTEAAMLALDAGLDVVPQALLEQAARSTKPQITSEMLRFYSSLSW